MYWTVLHHVFMLISKLIVLKSIFKNNFVFILVFRYWGDFDHLRFRRFFQNTIIELSTSMIVGVVQGYMKMKKVVIFQALKLDFVVLWPQKLPQKFEPI